VNRRTALAAATLLAAAAATAGCSGSSPSAASSGTQLNGTFRIDAGSCAGGTLSGTYFRMVQRGGTVEKGKYFQNPDSTCPDKSISVQQPGTDGGLVTGSFQPVSGAAFDAKGNALAARITKPGSFTAIRFALSTNAKDPQSGKSAEAPEIFEKDGRLTGQVSAFTASWNNLFFNQGSPKPDGSRPGLTTPVTGTYDAATKAYTLSWASEIQGGAFDGFAGYWHLQGTFVPS
jgi:hypothetical protein